MLNYNVTIVWVTFPSYTSGEDLDMDADRITKVNSHCECSSFQKESRQPTWVLSVVIHLDNAQVVQVREEKALMNLILEQCMMGGPPECLFVTTEMTLTKMLFCLFHQRNQWWTPSPCPTCIRSWRVTLGPVSCCQIPATENCWSSSGTNPQSLARMYIFISADNMPWCKTKNLCLLAGLIMHAWQWKRAKTKT